MTLNNSNNSTPPKHALDAYTARPEHSTGGESNTPFYKSAAPSISLPKGGGALKGIDEKFSVNAVNGTAGLEIPLPLTPGRGGFTPGLSLSYNSGSGNSAFGLGWALGLPSIQRKTDKKLPQYHDAGESDVFLLAGAEDLIPLLKENGDEDQFVTPELLIVKRYIPRIEGLFARIEFIKNSQGASWWRVTTKDNITTWYGLTGDARIADPEDDKRIYSWLPQLTIDHKGNVQQYSYLPEDDRAVQHLLHEHHRRAGGPAKYTNTYLKSVRYCNKTPWPGTGVNLYDPAVATWPPVADFLMEAVLDYGDHSSPYSALPDQDWDYRTDAFSDYRAGFEIRTYRKCRRVLMFHYFEELNGHHLVRSLELAYQNDNNPNALTEADFIVSATQRGYDYRDSAWVSSALPPMTFAYQPLQWNNSVQSVDRDDFQGAPQGLTGPYQWTDFEGEGISGILTEQDTGWFYKHNLGDGHFTPPQAIAQKPSFQGLGRALQWADLDADGRRQVVAEGPVSGYWELDDDQQWQAFRTFPKNINIDKNSPYTKMLDLDGDGRPDVLVTEDRVWTWYKNEGKEGFDLGGYSPVFHDEEKGPVLLLRDSVQSIFLADMSGDGMTDLVRITNGGVCYWPNMGWGKFGAKVEMMNAPAFQYPDQYNALYLTLADVSGTGAADLIYIGPGNTCTAWLNLSGNGWSEAKELATLPGTDPYSKIAVLDFLGNGTGCIVWSSPLPQHSHAPLRYIDLMGGHKPYLMNSYSNGMGKTVSVTYKSSTHFYLKDKAAGIPWATSLPFPVHCIETVSTHDSVSNTTFTQTYRYRHGYYDHEEREFRGFGYVETLDTDTALLPAPSTQSPIPYSQSLDQPPVLTKTWYHTGAWMREDTLLDAFQHEYHPFEGWDEVTTIVTFEENLRPQEMREAHRALKGSALRQEVYARDGSALQDAPYTVTASAYSVKRVQKMGTNRNASFLTLPDQSISFSCERRITDPRISQQMTLETDKYGNVLKSAAMVYPRRHNDGNLPLKVQQEQAKMHITLTENTFTNDAVSGHHYRLRLPCSAKTYELLGIAAPTGLWDRDSWDTAFTYATVTEIDYSATPTGYGTKEKRLLSHGRTLYKPNSAADTPLGLGVLESLAIPHEQYSLAFTTDILDRCYGTGVVGSTILEVNTTTPNEGGGYVRIDGAWWVPSGTVQYGNNPQDEFFTPVSFTDPWGNQTTATYWDSRPNATNYYLLPKSVTDAKGNANSVEEYDWRILQPKVMIDANENKSAICYDVLGMPVATAVMGKGSEADYLETLSLGAPQTLVPGIAGDNSDDSATQATFWDAASTIAQVEAAAKTLLGKATWRCIYNLDTVPTAVAMIGREEHFVNNNNSEVEIRVAYSDGFGRVAQEKAQCEPQTIDLIGNISFTTNWVCSGKTVYNNKGKAVLQYEPFFTHSHAYDEADYQREAGVSPLMHYDPLGRLFRTDMPDGSYSLTAWDSWMQTVWDANDTTSLNGTDSAWYNAHRSSSVSEERDAADKAYAHRDTPTVIYLDSLARPFFTVQNDGINPPIRSYEVLDITGNRLGVVDGLCITANPDNDPMTLQYRYNMLKAPCWQQSIDGGEGRILVDAAGQPLRHWDADDRLFRTICDSLRRPVAQWVTDTNGSRLFEQTFYLDTDTATAVENARGRMQAHYDGGGKQYIKNYDFKGMPLASYQQLLIDFKLSEPDWAASSPPVLESIAFATVVVTDALGRPVTATDAGGNVTRHEYDKGGMLQAVYLTPAGGSESPYVNDIHYDAKGQRKAIWYGNGTKTRYRYDPLTYRLTRLCTVNLNPSPHVILQDLSYYYDAVGNITTIRNDAQPVIFYNNTVIEPVKLYTYDALYRLIRAEGREQIGNATYGMGDNYGDNDHRIGSSNAEAVQNYTQSYTYDAVGNIRMLGHNADSAGSYTRAFSYDPGSNRLTGTNVITNVATPYAYDYDNRGNMLSMPHLQQMDWNSGNQLGHVSDGNVDSWYQYSGGQRIRKAVFKAGDITEERVYLGSYERYRKYIGGAIDVERSTVHVSDDTGRIAMLEVLNPIYNSDGAEPVLTRYIYADHLQSSSLEVSEAGELISYEEYHPYGTTAYQATSASINAVAKRYRFTGKERDEETGLNYHGARYYAPWLCRWVSVDPLESKYTPQSPYVYCSNNPISKIDPSGMGDREWHAPMALPEKSVNAGFPSGSGSYNHPIKMDAFTFHIAQIPLSADVLSRQPAPQSVVRDTITTNAGITYTVPYGSSTMPPKTVIGVDTRSSEAFGEHLRNSPFAATVGYYWRGEQGAALGDAIGDLGMAMISTAGTPYGRPEIETRPIRETYEARTESKAGLPKGKAAQAEISTSKNGNVTYTLTTEQAAEVNTNYATNRVNLNQLSTLQNKFEVLAKTQLLPQYLKIDPNLEAGYTGSFKTGVVGNPSKSSYGQPVNLTSFDIDFWIKSDELFKIYGRNLKANPSFRTILGSTPGFEGLKPNKQGFSIKFLPSK